MWRKDRIENRQAKQSARSKKVEETRSQQRSEMLETLGKKGERDAEVMHTKHRTEEEQRVMKGKEKEARIALMRETRDLAAARREEERLKAAETLSLQQEADALALQERALRKEEDAIIAAEMEKILPDRAPKFGANVIGGAWVPSPPVSNKPSPRVLQEERRLRETQEKKDLDRKHISPASTAIADLISRDGSLNCCLCLQARRSSSGGMR